MDGLWDWQPFSLFWVNSGFTCLKDMNADHLNSLALFGSFVVFSMGRKAKDGEPQVIANLWEGVLMYTGLRDGDPLSDWSSFGWIVPFSFCKNTLNTTNSHQAICKHFVLATTCLQVENLPVLTAFVYESVTGQRSRWFQKKTFKARVCQWFGVLWPQIYVKNKQITIESELTKNSGISIWSPRHRFCSQIAAHERKPPTKSATVPFYTQKSRANLTINYFDFSFWAWKPTE